ncbi:hypothetical protein FocTR4_00011570 [Fusarium oxysporum f. sp. cubense]|uniref:2EXR domain-containing protein n=1 Tax=Fusarium oxysporum f. sp. cubense TaxID=61366 RepID=A0A5C6SGR2_FUSOC|nr:hypothetical protein FocTR4_00011570 [Fusarium oxysporum f. sp. cubense]
MNLEAQEHAGASSLLDYNTSFPQFQKLDPVIQRLIWEYTLPSSRVHYVEYIQFVPALVNPQGRYLNIKCPPVPITFSVSEQSRYVVSLHMTRYGIEFDEPYQATAFERDLKAWRNEQVAKAMMKGKTMPEIKIAEMALACECADVKERMEEKVRELNRAAMSQTLEQDRLE